MNIPEKAKQIKAWVNTGRGQIIIILLVLVISNIASFSLGRQSLKESLDKPKSTLSSTHSYSLADPELPKTGSLASAIYASTGSQNAPNTSVITQNGEEVGNSPRYVASKKGRVYYFTWCTGAKGILEENKRYFNTSIEARSTGLKPSTACPDLD